MSYLSINPYNGGLVTRFDEHTDQQVESAIATAATCFQTWRKLTFAERAGIVSKAANIMREPAEEFARPMTLEMGKLFAESVGEVMLSADILDYYAIHAERFLAPEQLTPGLGESVVESSPLGVLFGVQPWNFPYYQLARFAAPNLMAGNVVMVKHSGTVPQCAIAFEQLWLEAAAPAGGYTNLLISHEQALAAKARYNYWFSHGGRERAQSAALAIIPAPKPETWPCLPFSRAVGYTSCHRVHSRSGRR